MRWILLFLTSLAFLFNDLHSADLTISGQNNRTYEGTRYDRLRISNSSYITLRNCTLAVNSGDVVDIASSNNITLENCDVDGLIDACTGINIRSSSYITIKNCTIHDIADDGFQINGGHHYYLLGNRVWRLYGCGPCFNGHSDGIETFNVRDLEVKGNLIYDVRSTAAFFIGGNGTCSNFTVENNIFYTPRCGFVMYVQYTNGIKIYNNVMWKGVYGGLAVGQDVTNIKVFNNILHSFNTTHMSGTLADADHDYNLVAKTGQGVPLSPNELSLTDPKFKKIPDINSSTRYTDVIAADFEPMQALVTSYRQKEPGHKKLKKLLDKEQEEIQMVKNDPARFGSIYYILQKKEGTP